MAVRKKKCFSSDNATVNWDNYHGQQNDFPGIITKGRTTD